VKITGQQRDDFGWQAISSGCHLDDQPIRPCHGPLVVVANDEVVQRRLGSLHLKRPGGPRSPLEQRPGCGYKQKQMANSCCPLSCQGPEDLSAK